MVLTPTYYAFYLYQNHQDATLVDSYLESPVTGTEENKVPTLHESVSMSDDGHINITINNLSLTESQEVESIFTDWKAQNVKGTILTGKMDDYNTFENPDVVKLQDFTDVTLTEQGLKFTIPPCSVLHLEVY